MKPYLSHTHLIKTGLTLLFGIFAIKSQAQVGIGTTSPHPSSMIHITAGPGQNKGALLPGVPSSNRVILDSTQNIANGLIIFDEDLQRHYYFNENPKEWKELDHDWVREDVEGAGATIGQNIHLGVSGNVGIGIAAPTGKLSVAGRVEIGSATWTTNNQASVNNSLIVQTWIGAGMDTRSSSVYKIEANGSIRATNDLRAEDDVFVGDDLSVGGQVTGDLEVAAPGRFIGKGVMPRGSVVAWAGNPNTYFPGGAGTGEFSGWYICDGRNATPDLRGRFIAGQSNTNTGNPGGTTINGQIYQNLNNNMANHGDFNVNGETGGATDVTLSVNQMPSHNHSVQTEHVPSSPSYSASNSFARAIERDATPFDAILGQYGNTFFSSAYISESNRGGNQAHENLPPYLTLVYIIYLP